MKKKILCAVLAVLLVVSMMVPAGAATKEQQNTADALNALGLFLGTGTNPDGTPIYALDNNLTREQGVMLLLRMLGKLGEAEACTATHPFTDIKAPYYDKYLAYAYETKLTSGTSATTFGYGKPMTERMFLTFTLRALGYTDGEKTNYVWNNCYRLGRQNHLIEGYNVRENLLRGEAIEIFWNALRAKLYGQEKTLAEKLMDEGVFTEQEHNKALVTDKEGKAGSEKQSCQHESSKVTVIKEASCEVEGQWQRVCKDCGYVLEEGTIPALEHNYVEKITKQPTRSAKGEKTFTCSICKDSYTEVIAAIGLPTWEEYQAMDGPEKDAFFASFDDPMDFVEWMQTAQAVYNQQHPVIYIEPGDPIDLSEYA